MEIKELRKSVCRERKDLKIISDPFDVNMRREL